MRNVMIIMAAAIVPVLAFAQEEVSIVELINTVVALAGDAKNLGVLGAVAAGLTLLISTMKNSLISQYTWDKLPAWSKVFVAPVLSLIAAAIVVTPFSLKTVGVSLLMGSASIALHDVLDSVKKMPGIGKTWLKVIDVLGKVLRNPKLLEAVMGKKDQK